MKSLFHLFFGIWLVLLSWGVFPAFTQTNELAKINEQIRSLVQNKNYGRALLELNDVVANDPESILARSWQVIIYLTREDSVQNASLPVGISQFDPRYNFDLVMENVDFLQQVTAENPLERELQDRALKLYRENFEDLMVALPQAPVTGFFRIQVPLEFIPPFRLFPVQQKRLEEINTHFEQGGFLYFNRFNPQKKEFFAVVRGFPILRQFEGEYDVAVRYTGDTLSLEYNNMVRDTLRIPYQKIDSLVYDLPPDYVQLYFDTDLQVRVPPTDRPFIQKRLSDYQVVLMPVDMENRLTLSRNEKAWHRWVLWGGVVGLATGFLIMVR